jgi:hypothetical protein
MEATECRPVATAGASQSERSRTFGVSRRIADDPALTRRPGPSGVGESVERAPGHLHAIMPVIAGARIVGHDGWNQLSSLQLSQSNAFDVAGDNGLSNSERRNERQKLHDTLERANLLLELVDEERETLENRGYKVAGRTDACQQDGRDLGVDPSTEIKIARSRSSPGHLFHRVDESARGHPV